jgi:ABC-2 type transport system ATP-binding protein
LIIHRGKLVAQQPVAELIARASGATRVRSPRADDLLARLRDAGIEAKAAGEGLLAVQARPETVGDLAAEAGIPVHELVVDSGSLEEAFLELTSESPE